MRYLTLLVIVFLFLYVPVTFAHSAENSSMPKVVANDNRTPAGHLKNGILGLRLELRTAIWYPEDNAGGHRDVYAFAEEGHAPQSSGPLIRVPAGTQVHLSIHNELSLAAKIYGLHRHPGDPTEAVTLAPDEARELQFLVGEAGTYPYWATTSDSTLERRKGEETLLSGAFVVDRPGVNEQDHIFVLGVWEKIIDTGSELIPWINGKSWPHTEHLTYNLGEKVRWRVINTSNDPHAMHLHGFFFTVAGVGDGDRFEEYAEELRRQVVTEPIDRGHTFEMTWRPERAGNWLFHCHMMMHMAVPLGLHPKEAQPPAYSAEHDHAGGMGGLVVGVTILPGAISAPSPVVTKAPRKLQLVISENPDKIPLYRLELNDTQIPSEPDKKKPPLLLGPPIILTREVQTEIEVKNLTTSPTAIHWHGIELESFYDGVPGWTGSGQQTTPAIAPGASFVARMAPPRAGTFIYHTHWHDETQLVNGMYGPLIVLNPEQKYEPERDKTFVFGTGKYAPFGAMLLVNGTPEPESVELKTGTRYRLRLINITTNESDLRVSLASQDVPLEWKVVAIDGADLPMSQQKPSKADLTITVGSTCDVEFQSDREGYVEMRISARGFEALIMQPFDFVRAK